MSFGGSSWGKPAQSGNPLFGQSNPTQPGGNPFGASQPATSSFGTFGTQPQAQGPAQGTSLFGAPFGQNNQQQGSQSQGPAQGSSAFGTLGQTQQGQQGQAPSQGNPLFGNALGQQQQPQQGSSFLGVPGQNQQQQQPQQQAPSNFFAQPPANTSNSLGASLFGNAQNQQSGQQQNAFGLGSLGRSTAAPSTLGSLGSFGSTLQPQPPQQSNPFGQSTGASLFGKQPSQQTGLGASTQVSGAPPFMKSTKFNDLPEDIKKVLEGIDQHIQGRVQISGDLKQRKLGEEALKGQELVWTVHKDLLSAITTLHSDVHHTRDLKGRVDQTVQDTIIATRIVDGFRNPQHYGMHLKNHADFPLEVFSRFTEQMRERLRWYKATIEQIERKLSSAAAQSQYTPQVITSTLEAQHATFIALASKVASLDAELHKIKALYTQLWRARTGSMRDPFNDVDRGSGGEFGLESIGGK